MLSADVAQMVEQRIRNAWVGCSIHLIGSKLSRACNMQSKAKLSHFIAAFLVPMLLCKTAVLYFGLNYAELPGQGYGIGLAISIVITILLIIHFLWKYRNYEDL